MRAGVPAADLPPKPAIRADLLWVWRTWNRLSADRPWIAGGMGPPVPGRIPWALVRRWAKTHRLSWNEFLFLDRGLGAMDEFYLEHWRISQNQGAGEDIADKLVRFDRS